MAFDVLNHRLFKTAAVLLAIGGLFTAAVPDVSAVVVQRASIGIVKGVIRDPGGNPIADATVAFFRVGSTKILKQVQSAADGSFFARIVPGTYSVLAVAEGFNPVTLPSVEVNRSAQLTYGFKLERAGGGRTLPERRPDRNNPKWSIRSSQMSRSVYQNNDDDPAAGRFEIREKPDDTDITANARKGKTVVETYFASSENGNFTGVNAATFIPLGTDAELIVAGQAGFGKGAPQRVESRLKFRPSGDHQIRVNTSFGKLATIVKDGDEQTLGQASLQAFDEWNVREGLVVVYGVDYTQFIGAGSDMTISPRLGLQYDVDAKTRFRTAYTTQTEERTWSRAIEMEGDTIAMREPVSMQDIVIEDGRPKMNRSARLEFGVERVLDNRSSLEANVFTDTIFTRGVSFVGMPLEASNQQLAEFTAEQHGGARGLRLVYSRRLNWRMNASAGYSVGTGQQFSGRGLFDRSELFEQAVFQTFFGQLDADLRTGTNIRTVVRFSPEATLFAIDPFNGRLAIYDPGLSVFVTQNLPNLGLPFQAQATLDARNIFGMQSEAAAGDQGVLRLNGHQRLLRGGILVRF